MQKRPSSVHRIEFMPIPLSEEFPLSRGRQRGHADEPIRRLHLHDCLEIGYCHAGSGIFVVGEKVMAFGVGDVMVITENETHLARSTPGTTSDWTWLYLDPWRLLGRSNPGASWLSMQQLTGRTFVNVFTHKEGKHLAGLILAAIREIENRDAGWEDATRGLLTATLCQVHRHCSAGMPATTPGGISQLGPALDYIATHYATEISLEQLARLCGISLTHFRRQFREVLGKSPHRYLLELRVQAAAAAMRDVRKRISEAAFDAGFSTLSTFNRAFRDVLGEAPRTWRNSRHSSRDPGIARAKSNQKR